MWHAVKALVWASLLGILLAGCASPRTAELDQAVRRVAVVSVMDEATPVERRGLTIFERTSRTVDQSGVLNNLVIDTVESQLRRARPAWTLVDARAEVAGLGTAWRKKGASWEDQQRLVAQLATKLGVDHVFVVKDSGSQNFEGDGLGLSFRAIIPDQKLGFTMIHTFISLQMRNERGELVSSREAGLDPNRDFQTRDLGLNFDLSALDRPEVQARVKSVTQPLLRQAVLSALSRMGYGP